MNRETDEGFSEAEERGRDLVKTRDPDDLCLPSLTTSSPLPHLSVSLRISRPVS